MPCLHEEGTSSRDLRSQGVREAKNSASTTNSGTGLWSSAGRCLTPLIALQNVAEAQCIANQVQLFYATDRKEIFGLVETFNFRPNEFKYMSVIAELEQSGLGAELKCAQNKDKT